MYLKILEISVSLLLVYYTVINFAHTYIYPSLFITSGLEIAKYESDSCIAASIINC